MAIAEFNLESRFLNTKTRVTVLLPDMPRDSETPRAFYESGQKYRTLFLLHGTYGDATDWVRKTNIELYAAENDLAVVLPSALNTNYVNWPRFSVGYNFYDFFMLELMPFAHNWLPLSGRREDNFLCGLSMGAWGSALYALNEPRRFAGAAMLSGFPLGGPGWDENTILGPRMRTILGNYPGGAAEFLRSSENTWRICRERAGGDLPEMYFSIGTGDFMFPEYLRFKEYAKEIGLNATFEEFPDYGHEWRFWEMSIQRVLAFFGISGEKKGNAF